MPILDRLRLRSPAVLLVVGLAVAAVAGCGGAGPQNPASSAAQSASLADVLDKLEAIGQDECATHPPASIYPGCTRFLTELVSALNSARSESAGLPQSASITAAIDPITSAISDFTQRACAPPPGQPPSGDGAADPRCVADAATIQTGLRQLIAVLSPVVPHRATPS